MGRRFLVVVYAVFFIVVLRLTHFNNANDDDHDSMSPEGGTVACNKTNYTTVYPTDGYVRHVLEELGDEVSKSEGYAVVINFPEIDHPIMSGQGACVKNVSREVCAECLKDGAKKVLAVCSQRVGARFDATRCHLRYDVY